MTEINLSVHIYITINTKSCDEHEDQSPQNSKVSLVTEALPGLTYHRPLCENFGFHSKINVQTLLIGVCLF